MKIALVSFNPSDNFVKNANKAKSYIQDAKEQGADLVIFPEMTLTGFLTDVENFTCENEITDIFLNSGIDVIFGAGINENNKFYNRLIWLDADSKVNLRFNKLHAFSYGGENNISLGSDLITHKLLDKTFGFGICYDLRFAETFSKNASNCDIFVVIACWPKARVKEWKILLQARAIENQAIFIGVNRSGKTKQNSYEKSSFIALPNALKIAPIYKHNELEIYNLDFKNIKHLNFNPLVDKRIDLC